MSRFSLDNGDALSQNSCDESNSKLVEVLFAQVLEIHPIGLVPWRDPRITSNIKICKPFSDFPPDRKLRLLG